MTTLAPVRRRKRHALQCQHLGCESPATRMCDRAVLRCEEHVHGDCCKAVLL